MSLLEIRNLTVTFGHGARAVNAVDGVSLDVERGRVVGLVGASGSGKSTLARAVAGLQRATSGSITIERRDLLRTRRRDALERASLVQMIFQDPFSSLNPRMTIGEAIDEVLITHERRLGPRRREAVGELLELVRLKKAVAHQYPSELSGGMRQRAAIARCLAVRPKLIVADEITSALDASVQGAVLNLIRELQAELDLSMLFITHNLAAVRYIADTTAVMSEGRIVERGPSDAIVSAPTHPYTQELVDAIPRIEHAGLGVLLNR